MVGLSFCSKKRCRPVHELSYYNDLSFGQLLSVRIPGSGAFPMRSKLLIACLITLAVSNGFEPFANAGVTGAKRGFAKSTGAEVTVSELIAHPELWVMDVEFKPLRMLRSRTNGLVWYSVFRVVNRDLNRKVDTSNTVPQNASDSVPRQLFSPRFSLVTADGDEPKTYADIIDPAIQAEIAKREGLKLLNPIQLAGELPPVTKTGADNEEENARYGVVLWKNIDPKTDRFTLFMTGFSNGYRLVKGPDMETLVERKTIVQKYWRPGDEFNQDEREVRFDADPKWIYRVEEQKLDFEVDVPVGTPPHTVGVE